MSTTQIVPAIDLKGLEGALAELQQEAVILPELKKQAEALTVKNQDEYTNAGVLLSRVRSIKKVGKFKIGPFQEVAKRVTDFLRGELTKHEAQADAVDSIISGKMEFFRTEEKRLAAIEQQRMQEEARKAQEAKAAEERKAEEKRIAEEKKKRDKEIEEARKAGELNKKEAEKLQKKADEEAAKQKEEAKKQEVLTAAAVPKVEVAPAIPKVAGLRGQERWKFKIVDATKIPRQWLVPDEVSIGAHVRFIKNKKLAEESIPGIEVWSEESV